MAGLRPFRGLRYADGAGTLDSLVASASGTLTPSGRESYVARSPHNAIHLAFPEGHADDRSKFVRYARAAARLAELKREGVLRVEARPAFYRLTQRFGDEVAHVTLLAVADLDAAVRPVEATDVKAREDRLRLLEATRTAFEPAVALYEDPDGSILAAVRAAPASSETAASFENVAATLETIDDPAAIEALVAAFQGGELLVADGVDAYEASKAFRTSLGTRDGRVPEDGVFLALASLDDASYARLPIHRVVRRFPGGLSREALLTRLATRFTIEEHHNRNLSVYIDRATSPAFGLATEGGLGYLLTPTAPLEEPASLWLQREVLSGLLGVSDSDSELAFTDPLQAIRATDEGAAAAFILPRPGRTDLRRGFVLPHRSASTFPAVPTGLVFWSMGDDV